MSDNFNGRLKVDTNIGGKMVSQDEVRKAHYETNQQQDAPEAFLKALEEIKRSGKDVLKPKPGVKQIKRRRAQPKADDAALREAASKDLKKRNLKN